jgi:hypothetical protein
VNEAYQVFGSRVGAQDGFRDEVEAADRGLNGRLDAAAAFNRTRRSEQGWREDEERGPTETRADIFLTSSAEGTR